MTSCRQNACLASIHHHIVTLQVEESDPSDFEFEDEELEGKPARLESDEEELSPDDDDESGACVRLYSTPALICAVHAAFACSVMLCFARSMMLGWHVIQCSSVAASCFHAHTTCVVVKEVVSDGMC